MLKHIPTIFQQTYQKYTKNIPIYIQKCPRYKKIYQDIPRCTKYTSCGGSAWPRGAGQGRGGSAWPSPRGAQKGINRQIWKSLNLI